MKKRQKVELDDIEFTFGGGSDMPYTHRELIHKLNDAYAEVSAQYEFVQQMRSHVKFVALSELMTYTHISGVYTFYTGEANININFPDYTLPYTAAHEMSHQRGLRPRMKRILWPFWSAKRRTIHIYGTAAI